MITPTEMLYWEVLPALRSEMVKCLKECNLSQKDIAELLGITPSAVSQYLKGKRGKLEFTDLFKEKIKEKSIHVSGNKIKVFEATNSLMKEFESSKDLCVLCRAHNKDIKKGCDVCFT